MDRAQVEDIVARSRAETQVQLANLETRLAEMSGKMDRLFAGFEHTQQDNSDTRAEVRSLRSDIRSSKATTVGTGLGVAALMVALVMGIPSWTGYGQHQQEVIQQQVDNSVAMAEVRRTQALTAPQPTPPSTKLLTDQRTK